MTRLVFILLLLAFTAVLRAESGLKILLVVGSGGTETFTKEFAETSALWIDAAKKGEALVEVIGLDSPADGAKTDAEILKEKLASDKSPELWLVFIGHGTFDQRETKFNFRGPDQEKKVGKLSGGERNRVHLAKLLRRGSNVLLLDEPTNDLDVDTLRALEEAILNYAGCVVVISHDRWFLDRIATHILAFEGDGHVHWCEGNFATYEQQRKERLGIGEDEVRKFRYKKITT